MKIPDHEGLTCFLIPARCRASSDTSRQRIARSRAKPPVILWLLVLVNVLVELSLLAADHRVFGSLFWRPLAYQYAGFWAGLLWDWQPNYPGQVLLMFATSSFLHAGLGHLLGNMAVLIVLARDVCGQFSQRGFLLIYAASVLGGALTFGLLSYSVAPMVGASGAIYGLAGAILYDEWSERRSVPWVAGAILALVTLNLATWLLMEGHVAWQAHLGGALAGAIVAGLIRRN